MNEFLDVVPELIFLTLMMIILVGITITLTHDDWKDWWKASPFIFSGMMIMFALIYLVIILPLEWIGENL